MKTEFAHVAENVLQQMFQLEIDNLKELFDDFGYDTDTTHWETEAACIRTLTQSAPAILPDIEKSKLYSDLEQIAELLDTCDEFYVSDIRQILDKYSSEF
jgi:hypothetical protein